VLSGALFAFIASFDEIIVLFITTLGSTPCRSGCSRTTSARKSPASPSCWASSGA